jgi:MFS family permease
MAGLQVPAGSLANRMGGRVVLALGTALTALGFLLAGFTGSLPGLCIALAAAGAGSSTQHPIGSAAVARAYGARARGPLGIYNFSGDLGLALVFLGGAGGKFFCGWLGGRLGVLWTVVLTEGGTAAAILLLLALPLTPALAVLPLLGIMLNGTSSVLYGTVPELTAADQGERSFALFYTGTIGAGAISPVLYGLLGDAVGVTWATAATAITALATLPLAMALAPHLAKDQGLPT